MDDTLTIDIESTNNAGSGIDSLIAKLEQLKVSINENLKSIGRLNSALINLGSVSKNVSLAKINPPSVNAPTPIESIQQETPASNTAKIVKAQAQAQASIRATSEEANNAGRAMDNLSNKGGKSAKDIEKGMKQSKQEMERLRSSATKLMFTLAGKGFKSLALPFKALFSTIRQGKSNISEMGNSFESLVKKLKMTTLALLGARGAFTAIRKAVNAYMQYDTALSKTLQNNWAVLGSLIAPIIERLIALFSKLISYIATIIKLFTGVDLVARANAKALKSQASGAKSASKAVKDLSDELGNLQKFDDLNVVDFPKDSGAGAGGGGAGAGGLDPLKIQAVDLSPLENFIDFIKRNDWYGLGMEISRAFNDGLRLIDFDWLEEKARQWGKNMGDLFNGLTDGLDWALVGNKIAGGLNTAMAFVNTFFETYNFDHLGEGLAEGLNSVVEYVKWDALGVFLTNKIRAFFETALAFVDSFDWTKFGTSIGTSINSAVKNIKLSDVAKTLSVGIQGMLDSVSSMIYEVDWQGLADNINEGVSNLDLSGVADKINEVYQNGWEALMTFIHEVDWTELGNQIGEGLATIDWLGMFIRATKTVKIELPKLAWKFAWGLVKGVVNGLTEKMPQLFAELLGAIGEGIDTISDTIYEKWDKFKQWYEESMGVIAGFIKLKLEEFAYKIGEKLKNIKEDIKEKAKDAVDFVKEKFSWENIKNTFETIKTKIGEKFTNIRDGIKDKMQEAVNKLKSFFTWENIKTTFTTLVDKIKEKFGEIGTNVGTVLSSKFNEVVSKIINKAVDGINGFIRAVNKAISVINEIPGVKLNKLDTIDYPKLAVGTNKIEVEGLYHLHEGEAVVPKKYNPAVNNKAYTENNDKMISRMDTLIELLNNAERTTIVNVGNEELYSKTNKYINRQSDIYGTSNW